MFLDLVLCETSGARVTWFGSLVMVWECVPRRAFGFGLGCGVLIGGGCVQLEH